VDTCGKFLETEMEEGRGHETEGEEETRKKEERLEIVSDKEAIQRYKEIIGKKKGQEEDAIEEKWSRDPVG